MNTITSYITLKDKVAEFCDRNKFVKRFEGSFLSELNNFSNDTEKFPIVYMVPVSETLFDNTVNFEIDLYCLDIIRDDKANLDNVISETNMVIHDFWVYVKQGRDFSWDIIGQPFIEPINNYLLDNVAGWKGRYTIEVMNYCYNQLPLN